MNDRYRTEQTGSTRKSAASAKPKRAAGETGPVSKPKESGKRSLLKAEQSPEMKKWRRIWWIFIGIALLLAFLGIPLQKYPPWNQIVLVLYAVFLGIALYLEFGPLRKARLAMMEEQKTKGKDKGKGGKA
jgi:hypothetical protein